MTTNNDDIEHESLFFIDKSGHVSNDNDVKDRKNAETKERETLKNKTKPALWHDSDDECVQVDLSSNARLLKLRHTASERLLAGTEYQNRLRKQFELLFPKPAWTSSVFPDNENEEDELASFHFPTFTKKSKKSIQLFTDSIIDISKLSDANRAEPSKAVIQTLSFHPKANLLLVGGYDKILRIFQVNETENPFIKSIGIDQFPIVHAKFTPDGNEIYISGKKRHFYIYHIESASMEKMPGIPGSSESSYVDLVPSPDNKLVGVASKNGYIHLLGRTSKQLVSSLKMNGSVSSLAFSSDGRYLYSYGSEHDLYVWDLRNSFKCVQCVPDYAGNKGTSLALSPNDQFVATGGDTGVVHIYKAQSLHQTQSNYRPQKELLNLTTHVDQLKFNHDSQVLCMSSRSIKNAIRLVHMPTMTVFSNWPFTSHNLNYVSTFDWSPTSQYLAIGNDQGRVHLYNLNYYN